MKLLVSIKTVAALTLAMLLISCSSLQKPDSGDAVVIKTSKGDIKIKLAVKEAPETVANFLKYVDDGHYKNTIFHRVMDGFMIQGGGFDAEFNQKPTRESIKNEAANGLKNTRGTIAMARTSMPHSARAQFFINVKDNPFLDFKQPTMRGYGYCVFGEVIDGMEVVDKIKVVPTGERNGHANVPGENVVIYDIVRE